MLVGPTFWVVAHVVPLAFEPAGHVISVLAMPAMSPVSFVENRAENPRSAEATDVQVSRTATSSTVARRAARSGRWGTMPPPSARRLPNWSPRRAGENPDPDICDIAPAFAVACRPSWDERRRA
ncbi:hypothetical protein GKE82_08570 [Conexibacter sp. W3-3-2]|uniref:hypothetical protein n=1 Tax=Conexibacter sp. W3-3-2 TaxID=2675227 RepID=UPI0012B8C270|nr:hypothetical protein [Conexibacter sp. W3-3-2]MTD44347.1 hypothetical protein [Conexibacter sp. W3-3-2]